MTQPPSEIRNNQSQRYGVPKQPLSEFYYDKNATKTYRKQQDFRVQNSPQSPHHKLPVTNMSQQLQHLLKPQSPQRRICDSTSKLVTPKLPASQQALLSTIRYLESKLNSYKAKMKADRDQMVQISSMFQSYFESTRHLTTQYKQKIADFENQLRKLANQSNRGAQTLKNQFADTNSDSSRKNNRIDSLQAAVKKQQRQIFELNDERKKKQRSISPLNKGGEGQKRAKQYSFGAKLSEVVKDNKQLKSTIVGLQKTIASLNESQRQNSKEYEQRILEKEQIIRKMSEFNNEMCMAIIKEKESNKCRDSELSTFKETPFRENIFGSHLNLSQRPSDLLRARSEKELTDFSSRIYEQKLILQQENCFLKKENTHLTKQNAILKESVEECNKKILSLQETVDDKNEKIDEFMIYINRKHTPTSLEKQYQDRCNIYRSQEISNSTSDGLKKRIQNLLSHNNSPLTVDLKTSNSARKNHKQADELLINDRLVPSMKCELSGRPNQDLNLKQNFEHNKVEALQDSLKNQKQINEILKDRIRNLESGKTNGLHKTEPRIEHPEDTQLRKTMTEFVNVLEELVKSNKADKAKNQTYNLRSCLNSTFTNQPSKINSPSKGSQKNFQDSGFQKQCIDIPIRLTQKRNFTKVTDSPIFIQNQISSNPNPEFNEKEKKPRQSDGKPKQIGKHAA